MGRFNEFSKGKIPLRYSIYENRKKGMTLRGLLIIIAFLTPFLATALTAKYLGYFSIIIGGLPLIFLVIFHKTSWEVKKLGHIEFSDSELIIKKSATIEIIPIDDINKIEFKKVYGTKSGRPLTFNLKFQLKKGIDFNLHTDRIADIEDRSKHFYSTPPVLEDTLTSLKENFKTKVWYDRI